MSYSPDKDRKESFILNPANPIEAFPLAQNREAMRLLVAVEGLPAGEKVLLGVYVRGIPTLVQLNGQDPLIANANPLYPNAGMEIDMPRASRFFFHYEGAADITVGFYLDDINHDHTL